MARPRAEIDASQVRGLARLQCTLEEIAAGCGVHRDTLRARLRDDEDLRDALEMGRAEARISLRRRMWDRALDDEDASERMQIWLSKQHLGMAERVEAAPPAEQEIPEWIQQLSPEQLADAERYLSALVVSPDGDPPPEGQDDARRLHAVDNAALPGVVAHDGDR